ncbi:ribonuclease H2, subunit B [Flagelloscypha sp. PMI_526]|nr:ribonuclease H2, subunit B [Flagelloscypha sp. PMI_526]
MSLPTDTRFLVLPKELIDSLEPPADGKSRFLRLPHPRTGLPALFLPKTADSPDGRDSILELHSISPDEPRSWFMGDNIFSDGSLLMLTRIDPVFLLIPIILSVQPKDSPLPFRPYDDLFEEADAKLNSGCNLDIIALSRLSCVQHAMQYLCDVQDVTEDLVAYRYSQTRLLDYAQKKVARISNREVLEQSRAIVRRLAAEGLMEEGEDSLLAAGRIKAACQLVGHYLPSELMGMLCAAYDFKALDEHTAAHVAAQTALIAPTTMSKKPTKKAQEPDSKKRKAAKGSTGVEKLKKTNTEGMAKLSSFFTKK